MNTNRQLLVSFAASLITLGAAFSATAAPEGLQGSVVAAERYRAAQEGAAAIKLQLTPVAHHAMSVAAHTLTGAVGVDVSKRNLENVESARRNLENVESARRNLENVEASKRMADKVEAERFAMKNTEAQRRAGGEL